MDWFNTAIMSAATLGLVNIIDSHLLSRRMPGLRAFLVPVSIIYLIYGLACFVLFPLPEDIGLWPILVAVASNIVRAAALLIMLDSLRREEVSQVIPVVYAYPIFVAMMAVPLLGESVSYLQWLAIFIVVAGAVMVSARQNPSGSTSWQWKTLLLLFGSSLLFAIADVSSKYALAYISSWNMLWIGTFCMSIVFLSVSVRPSVIRQLIDMERRGAAMGLLIFNETLALAGVAFSFWALERGPVALVSTIISSRPMFVLAFAFVLSRVSPMFLEWHSGRGILALRIVSTAMIVGGVAIIHLV